MKKTLILTALALALTACGGDHEKTHAVDVVETAEQNAKAAAPVAQPITFDDEKTAKASETPAPAETTSEPAPAEATDKPAETSEAKTDDKKTDEKAEETKAETDENADKKVE